VKSDEEQLLSGLARRNWIILLVMIVLSLLSRDKQITLGVVGGGLIAVCGYQWLYSSLVKTLSNAGQPMIKRFQFSYFLRLAALALMLMLLIAVVKVNTIGLIIGLSVVVLNIMLTTVKRVIK